MQRAAARHFSMLREFHLADFFTLGNAACGVGAVFFAMLYMSTQLAFHFYAAAALAPAAFIFDVLDGRIARARHQHSALGRELDSLSDVISFGVAPAALAFAAGMQGGWDVAALIFFVCCGVSRLARYNVTAETLAAGSNKVAYFEGTPIPTSVAAHRGAGLRRLARPCGRNPVRRRLHHRPLGPAPHVPAVRRLGEPDGQQDAAHSQAVSPGKENTRWPGPLTAPPGSCT